MVHWLSGPAAIPDSLRLLRRLRVLVMGYRGPVGFRASFGPDPLQGPVSMERRMKTKAVVEDGRSLGIKDTRPYSWRFTCLAKVGI